MGKMFFVDLTVCRACRGCQVACKQWKNLPAEKTRNTGSHQNPPDLSYVTLRTVHFREVAGKNGVDWLFFPEQCRHCTEPPCQMQADMSKEGAILHDEATGAVLFTPATAEVDFDEVRSACPYDIPRRDEKTGQLSKCDMCIDRVRQDMLPACVQSCPTGCMHFGDEEEMQALAQKRLAEVKKDYPDAVIGDADSVRVLYLFKEDPKKYMDHAVAAADGGAMYARRETGRGPLTRRGLFERVLRG